MHNSNRFIGINWIDLSGFNRGLKTGKCMCCTIYTKSLKKTTNEKFEETHWHFFGVRTKHEENLIDKFAKFLFYLHFVCAQRISFQAVRIEPSPNVFFPERMKTFLPVLWCCFAQIGSQAKSTAKIWWFVLPLEWQVIWTVRVLLVFTFLQKRNSLKWQTRKNPSSDGWNRRNK